MSSRNHQVWVDKGGFSEVVSDVQRHLVWGGVPATHSDPTTIQASTVVTENRRRTETLCFAEMGSENVNDAVKW